MPVLRYICFAGWIFFLLFSCKSKEAETVDFDQLAPASDKYTESGSIQPAEVKRILFTDTASAFSRQVIDSLGLDKNTIFGLDTSIFPDRFGATQTDKWYCVTPNDSLVFMRWKFGNGIKSENTFFNWLDCYGKRCKSVRVSEEANFSPRATLFLQQDKELIFIESGRKIDADKFIEVLNAQKTGKEWKYYVIQAPRAKAKWFSIDQEGKPQALKVQADNPSAGEMR